MANRPLHRLGPPERNDFLAVNQFRVDEPGGQAHKYVVPDVVLFVNGIPLVVIECKSPYVTDPAAEAIDQLQRYANQRARVHDEEGNERLFHTNQFVVATYSIRRWSAHLRREATTSPSGRRQSRSRVSEVAAELGKPLERLVEPGDSRRRDAPARAPARHRPQLHALHAD